MKKKHSILVALIAACTIALPMLVPGSVNAAPPPVITSVSYTSPAKEMCFYDTVGSYYANFGIKKLNAVYLPVPDLSVPAKFKKVKMGLAQGTVNNFKFEGSAIGLKTKFLDSSGKKGTAKITRVKGHILQGTFVYYIEASQTISRLIGSFGKLEIEDEAGNLLPHTMVWISCKDLPR